MSFLGSVDFLTNFETRLVEVVTLAVRLLSQETSLPQDENSLNRLLFRAIHRATRHVHMNSDGFDWPVFYEACNQPDASDLERATRESKRPDFQWGIYDHLEPDVEKSARYYVAECKRLGPMAEKSSWNFNQNYVVNGMLRFVDPVHGYGKSCRSGLMIGYVQGMELEDIFNEVNDHADVAVIERLRLALAGWQIDDVTRLDTSLQRPQVPPSPFDLRHIWIDLRGSYSTSGSITPTRNVSKTATD